MTLIERFSLYEQVLRLNKPIGTLLLLWPTLWGVWLAAEGHPNWMIIWIFVLGTVLMRSAGCAINDYSDRNFDAHVQRTKDRPLASGKLRPEEVLGLAVILSMCAFFLVMRLNKLTIMLSFTALFLAVTYPLTKRFLSIPQAYLGVAFGFGIPMAYAAQLNAVPAVCWVLLLANVFWAIAYDTEYAMVDREDDLKIGIKTAAITLGRFDVVGVMLSHIIFILIMAGVGWWLQLGIPYFLGLVVAAGFIGYQQVLIQERDRAKCFAAFQNNAWVGGAIFFGIVADFYWKIPIS